jgi:hypothetical protein
VNRLSLSADKTLVIETSVVTLRGAQACFHLNGAVPDNCNCEVLPLQRDQIEYVTHLHRWMEIHLALRSRSQTHIAIAGFNTGWKDLHWKSR